MSVSIDNSKLKIETILQINDLYSDLLKHEIKLLENKTRKEIKSLDLKRKLDTFDEEEEEEHIRSSIKSEPNFSIRAGIALLKDHFGENCKHVFKSGPRKGTTCNVWSSIGNYCDTHLTTQRMNDMKCNIEKFNLEKNDYKMEMEEKVQQIKKTKKDERQAEYEFSLYKLLEIYNTSLEKINNNIKIIQNKIQDSFAALTNVDVDLSKHLKVIQDEKYNKELKMKQEENEKQYQEEIKEIQSEIDEAVILKAMSNKNRKEYKLKKDQERIQSLKEKNKLQKKKNDEDYEKWKESKGANVCLT
jgi:hypothetical protein